MTFFVGGDQLEADRRGKNGNMSEGEVRGLHGDQGGEGTLL